MWAEGEEEEKELCAHRPTIVMDESAASGGGGGVVEAKAVPHPRFAFLHCLVLSPHRVQMVKQVRFGIFSPAGDIN
jgi:hypothetical protein